MFITKKLFLDRRRRAVSSLYIYNNRKKKGINNTLFIEYYLSIRGFFFIFVFLIAFFSNTYSFTAGAKIALFKIGVF